MLSRTISPRLHAARHHTITRDQKWPPPEIESISAYSLRLEAVEGQFRFGLDVFQPLKIEAFSYSTGYDSGEEFTTCNKERGDYRSRGRLRIVP